MSARVLVVANVTAATDDLVAALSARAARGPATFHLLMPATAPGALGRQEAEPRLEAALARWRAAGLDADGEVGDGDPVVAVHEAWDPRRYEEVIVSTLPGHASRWLRFDLPHRVAQITDCYAVSHVVARVPPEPAPLRHREPHREPLLASALSWVRH